MKVTTVVVGELTGIESDMIELLGIVLLTVAPSVLLACKTACQKENARQQVTDTD
jgi:hypothetical protein